MKYLILSVVLISTSTICSSQDINLEDIWLKYKFYAPSKDSYSWDSDTTYTTIQQDKIFRYDISSEEESIEILDLTTIPDTLKISSYEFSQEKYLMVLFNTESLYRRSSKSYVKVYDIETKQIVAWTSVKVYNPSFSPDEKMLAYGRTDWVYEEEFGFTKAYVWVEDMDGLNLAFLKFDESRVKTYDLQIWENSLYPELYKYKYPKVGEENSKVSLWLLSAKGDSKTVKIDSLNNKWEYFSKIEPNHTKTTNKQMTFSYAKTNRKQNHLELYTYNLFKGTKSKIYEEKAKTYIELPEGPYSYSKGFILDSYKGGYRHFYSYELGKNLQKKEKDLTPGEFDVKEFLYYDEKEKNLYFTALYKNSFTQSLCISKNGKVKQLIKTDDWTSVAISPKGSFATVTLSNVNKAPITYLYDLKNAKQLRVLSKNEEKQNLIGTLNLGKTDFFKIKNENKTSINCFKILPPDFDKNKKYPVLMHCYGGPGHQVVTNRWSHFDYFYHQLLAQKGYIVVLADGRGTDGRGTDFRHASYGQMGKVEHEDQVAVAKYMRELDYVDSNRIGIWGWSFGGYLSSLCLMKSPDIFSTAIAVAPVTNWKYYDNIYTERYMGLINENLKGYDENSPVNYAKNLKGNYLLIHGTADDNVHFQNAIAMQQELLKYNKQFEVFYYPDRNHGIYGGTTRYNLYKKMMDYILENL